MLPIIVQLSRVRDSACSMLPARSSLPLLSESRNRAVPGNRTVSVPGPTIAVLPCQLEFRLGWKVGWSANNAHHPKSLRSRTFIRSLAIQIARFSDEWLRHRCL